MRAIRAGLVAVLMLAFLAPVAAWAKAAAPPPISKEARAKGMADAPALITASGTDCQLADARLVGEGTDPKTKIKQTAYEVACTGGEGFLLVKKGDAVNAFPCIQADMPQADGKPSTSRCELPGNADPNAGLAPYIAKANLTCAPDKVRAIGQSATNTFFELSCPNNPGGFIMVTSSPMRPDKPVQVNPCIMVPENSNLACTLTPRAAQLAVVDRLNSLANKNCTIKDGGRGFLGEAQSGKTYYEAACSDGKGFILVEAPNGSLAEAIPCADADMILGGCKLTDTRQAKTEQAALYTDLSKKAGFDCAVSGYAPLPGKAGLANTEVVELACSNRPDGGIGFFGATASDPSTVYDCARSELVGYRCSLTKPSAAYAALTADLKALGRDSCTVSESRVVGLNAQEKTGFVEVGCSDGLQGYMLKYSVDPPLPMKPQAAIICVQASGISGGCQLPGNKPKAS
jgi:hypothetical protein